MYFDEFRLNLRPLAAACIGMATGSSLAHYVASLFGPALIAEFGWSRADYALVGSLTLINLLLMPFIGRFTDHFGGRKAAAAGFTILTLTYFALSRFNGGIALFFAITFVQNTVGGLTATLVFCRLTVQHFDRARGIALALIMTAAPLTGAMCAPWLGAIISGHGWRAAYVALACICALGGLLAVLGMRGERRAAERAIPFGLRWGELMQFLRSPLLLLILSGTFLINIPAVFASSQLTLVAMDAGASAEAAAWMVSLYATGVVVGRFFCGLSLDRIEPHLVAAVALGLPTIGYFTFASQPGAIVALYGAVAIIGLAQGAEGDIGAYLISRGFDLRNFSLLLSLMTATLGASSAVGALVLSVTLRLSGSYQTYMLICAATTLVGAMCFALTGSRLIKAPRKALAQDAG
jgi:MFS family permease